MGAPHRVGCVWRTSMFVHPSFLKRFRRNSATLASATCQISGSPNCLAEHLLGKGALDVWVVAATMKKARPGHVLSVLVEGGEKEMVVDTLMRESTTLGVRAYRVERTALERDWVEVETPWGKVRVKRGPRNGVVLNAHPEFEDCREVAEAV